MRSKLNQELVRRVVQFYLNHSNSQSLTVKHFVQEGNSRSTIYAILKRFRLTGQIEYSKNRSPKRTACSLANVRKIEKLFKDNPRLTLASAAAKVKISRTSVGKCLKLAGFETHKRKVAPNYVKDQAERCKQAAKALLKKTMSKNGTKLIVMDDETYVYKDPDENASNSFFREQQGSQVSDEVRFKKKTKFAGKYLVWQAISQDGRASPAHISEGTMNGDTYENVCIKGILVPWLKANFNVREILFWPDLATSHYKRSVLELLKQETIEFVSKSENAPNLPQARPIERYWALCKREYSKLQNKPKNLRCFRNTWSKISEKVIENSGLELFANLRNKLKLVKKYGPYGPLKVHNY